MRAGRKVASVREQSDDEWGDARVRELWEMVHRYLRRRVWRSDDADDLTQTVFLAAWKKREEIPDLPLFWLYGAALNDLRNYYRTSERFRRRHVFSDVEVMELAPAPGDEVEGMLTRNHVGQILDSLPEGDVEALRLRYLHDLTYEEASAILGISPGVMRGRVMRALERARLIVGVLDVEDSSGSAPAATPTSKRWGMSVEMRLRAAEGDPSALEYLSSPTGRR